MENNHTVNCYFCGGIFDERECVPADEYNGNDGGSICDKCVRDKLTDIPKSMRRS